METYGGWTEEDIEQAEESGEHIPDTVWNKYINNEPDQYNE